MFKKKKGPNRHLSFKPTDSKKRENKEKRKEKERKTLEWLKEGGKWKSGPL